MTPVAAFTLGLLLGGLVGTLIGILLVVLVSCSDYDRYEPVMLPDDEDFK